MADSPGGDSDSVPSGNDDSQLTIRIPNPRMYMERQSQWKGQRGKPRCDHCREHNLKCDRVLPTCNHCAFGSGKECKYTPLPTPAHRGIPRCDRCRFHNLKCDRNLPVCNFCIASEPGTVCNYTPKRRQKIPEPLPTKERSVRPILASKISSTASGSGAGDKDASGSPSVDGSDGGLYTSDGDDVVILSGPPASAPPVVRTMSAQLVTPAVVSSSSGPPRVGPETRPAAATTAPSAVVSTSRATGTEPYIAGTDPGIVLTPPQIRPWLHPAFAPLPTYLLRRLADLNAIEMPARGAFDDALTRFVADLSPELRATATFSPERYSELGRALYENTPQNLPQRVRMWTAAHHVQYGSERTNKLILLKESFFHLSTAEEHRLRGRYASNSDAITGPIPVGGKARAKDYDELNAEWARPFDRLPVQTQIFDVLSYAHRAHNSASSMLKECRRIGMATITWPIAEIYVRLCPLCNLRTRGQPMQPPGPASATR